MVSMFICSGTMIRMIDIFRDNEYPYIHRSHISASVGLLIYRKKWRI